ncbi:MAG TPA: methyltransferase domain-containing protein [Ktedonobacteraceae bacterium]|nr:methyltransferase domain-containing protein [Ktedonobacteraceae bacterium]
MIRYALSLARSQRLDNVRFQVMDATKPLDFSADSFDFVNARCIYGLMPRAVWPLFLQECLRVTRPGGFAHLAESEWSITNSLACERLGELVKQALFRAGLSFPPDGKNLGITTRLSRLLREAGCQNIRKSVSVLDFSAGEEANNAYSKNLLVAYELVQPFLIKMGVAGQDELDELLWQMQQDVLHDDFDGLIYILRAWGQKPS